MKEILEALKELDAAFRKVREALDTLDTEEKHALFAKGYPFAMSFDEQAEEVSAWVERIEEGTR